MAGIYIHIPFCKKACHYCNFHFSTSTQNIAAFTTALLQEVELQKDYLDNERVSTIYFGGGTPSLLPVVDLQRIVTKIYSTFLVDEKPEITLEANPDDINEAMLRHWKVLGINRLSIGVQSFFDRDLQWMNRAHNASQAIDCIHLAQKTGFNNITIDLIYGTPTLSNADWQHNVQQAIQLQIPHISSYALTVEPKTALEKMIIKKQIENVDSDKQASHFELLMTWMSEAGYDHYEISNFAKPGHKSQHNSSYWQAKKYLGLGPSAHSFNGQSRQWNVANNALYIKSLAQKKLHFEREVLTAKQQLNEYIMTSLRTMEGLHLNKVYTQFGDAPHKALLRQTLPHVMQSNLIMVDDYLKLTTKGKLLADGIAADLFEL